MKANLSPGVRAAVAQLERWYDDPCSFVKHELGAEPDPSQVELLTSFADISQQRIAMQASKGPGKTTGLVWCNLLFIATRPHPKMAACSISWDNLMDNFWTELAKWHGRSAYLKAKYKWTESSYFSIDHPETWWLSARSWARTADSQQQAVSLAGLHADHTLVTLDESGSMFQSVMDAADGTLATVGGEHRILQAGNPTSLTGPLYKASTRDRHLWKVIEVTGDPDNPKRSPRVSLAWANQQIESYGRDHDWVKVNVLGQFPSGSFNVLLTPDQVSTAMKRVLHETMYTHEAKILGVDPGRFGGARTVLFPRQGLAAHEPVILRPDRSQKNWTGAVVTRIAQAFEKWHCDVCFIDDTGGWGSGILDGVRALGFNAIGVTFGSNALDRKYKNRRCEMHFLAAKWVQDGGALPFSPELQREATATEYWFTGKQFQLEEKDQVSEKIGESPDLWDSFVLTFAQPVTPRTGIDFIDRKTMHAKTDPEEPTFHATRTALMERD